MVCALFGEMDMTLNKKKELFKFIKELSHMLDVRRYMVGGGNEFDFAAWYMIAHIYADAWIKEPRASLTTVTTRQDESEVKGFAKGTAPRDISRLFCAELMIENSDFVVIYSDKPDNKMRQILGMTINAGKRFMLVGEKNL